MNVVFVDNYLALDHALRLGVEGAEVAYFNEWRWGASPKLADYMIGEGFDEIRPVVDYHNLLRGWADVVFIADSGFGVLGDSLRREGIPVYGPSEGTDFLEMNRWRAAELMRDLGIKTPDYKLLTGVGELYSYVEAHRDSELYVKVNVVRGDVETFAIKRPEDLSAMITKAKMGPFAHTFQFLVSHKIEGIEIGVDAWFDGRDFIRPYHFGNEVKGYGTCFGKWVTESIWDDVLDRISPFLRRVGFTGSISFEAILNETGLYVLDVTPRIARPAGSLQYYSVQDYSSVVFRVATGENVELALNGTYTAQVGLSSLHDHDAWVRLCSKDDWRNWGWLALSTRCAVYNGDVWYYVPPQEIDIYTLAVGDDWVGTLKRAFGRANELGHEGFAVPTTAYEKAQGVVQGLAKMGIEW